LKIKYYCRYLVGLRSRIVIYRPATKSGCPGLGLHHHSEWI